MLLRKRKKLVRFWHKNLRCAASWSTILWTIKTLQYLGKVTNKIMKFGDDLHHMHKSLLSPVIVTQSDFIFFLNANNGYSKELKQQSLRLFHGQGMQLKVLTRLQSSQDNLFPGREGGGFQVAWSKVAPLKLWQPPLKVPSTKSSTQPSKNVDNRLLLFQIVWK